MGRDWAILSLIKINDCATLLLIKAFTELWLLPHFSFVIACTTIGVSTGVLYIPRQVTVTSSAWWTSHHQSANSTWQMFWHSLMFTPQVSLSQCPFPACFNQVNYPVFLFVFVCLSRQVTTDLYGSATRSIPATPASKFLPFSLVFLIKINLAPRHHIMIEKIRASNSKHVSTLQSEMLLSLAST